MQDLRERGPDADAAAGPSSPAPRRWPRVVAIAVSLAVVSVGVGGVLIWRAVEHGRPACQDATFGSSRGPVRQSPLSGVAGTDARLRAAFGRARGEVAYCNDFADPSSCALEAATTRIRRNPDR